MAFRPDLAATWKSNRPISARTALAEMDEAGITVHVLSASGPGAYLLDGADGIAFARDINDVLGKAVAAHPDRFAGFAHLPMRTPEAAADELERTVRDLGFCGALINGLTEGRFLDDPRFDPILARAEQLDVPIYLHPNLPPRGGPRRLLRRPAGPNRLSPVHGRLGLAFGNGHPRVPARPVRRARPASQAQADYRTHGRGACGDDGAVRQDPIRGGSSPRSVRSDRRSSIRSP